MADFTDVVDPVGTVEPEELGPVFTTEQHSLVPLVITDEGNIVSPSFFQRIYDSTAGYVYYTQDVINPTPASGDTTPNHTNNLVASTHEVIKEN